MCVQAKVVGGGLTSSTFVRWGNTIQYPRRQLLQQRVNSQKQLHRISSHQQIRLLMSLGETESGESLKPPRPSLRKLHFKNKAESNKKLQISFGGCGFLGVYHIGVGKCVVDHAPHLFSEFDTFYGASSGAITAVWAACKLDPMVPYKWVRVMFDDSTKYWLRMFSPYFDLYRQLRDFLEEQLPQHAHRMCRNVVKISLTVIGENGLPSNWLISDFNTRSELIDAVVASSFIPVYAGFKRLPKIRGRSCCDGGFTSNIPCVSDPDVITVTPFAGFCDICPQGESYTLHTVNVCDQPMQLSPKNLHRLAKSLCPTSWEELEELYHQGYKDCLSFFRKEGLVANPVVQKRRSPVHPTSFLPPVLVSRDSVPRSPRRTRMSSFTLLSNGEFFNITGSLGRGSVSSSPLDDVERGLDLRGTEKATTLTMRFGKEKNLAEDMERLRWKGRERRMSMVRRLVRQPITALEASWKGLSWVWHYCPSHKAVLKRLPLMWRRERHSNNHKGLPSTHDPLHHFTSEEEEHEEEENKGLLDQLISSYPSSMLKF